VGSVILADALRGTGIAGFGLRPCICRIPVVVEGGDFRSVFQLDAAALAVGVAGVALLGAGGSLGVLYLGAAIVVVRICVTPLVDVSIRSLVVAGTAVCVVLRRGNTGGLGLQVHIALNEKMRSLGFSSFFAIAAGVPVSILVVPIRIGFGKIVSAVVRLAADGACALCDAGRGAVTAAVLRLKRIAALALAGVGVGLAVAAGLPLAPVVTQNAVFTAAFLTGFARGAGGYFGAASVIITPEVAIFLAAWA
jgi:hypothetical protein